tara:strand:+ start:205 stop:447 length:243 start_codon:yes stop_codon:yes gene_type:complete
LKAFKEALYFLTLLYFCLTSIILFDFFIRADDENWLLPFNLFFFITFDGWLYLLSITFIVYFIRDKTSQAGRISFIPFKD